MGAQVNTKAHKEKANINKLTGLDKTAVPTIGTKSSNLQVMKQEGKR